MMDKEQREALELSKDDLLAKKEAGRPADVARTAPRRVTDAAMTIRVAPLDAASVQVKGLRFRTAS